jgi:hypothetical protein
VKSTLIGGVPDRGGRTDDIPEETAKAGDTAKETTEKQADGPADDMSDGTAEGMASEEAAHGRPSAGELMQSVIAPERYKPVANMCS